MNIFLLDFDGVVIDTLPIATETNNTIFEKFNLPKRFTEEEFAKLFLFNFHESLKKIVPNDELRKKILKERARIFMERINDFKMFEGIFDFLHHLDKNGKIIIVSSNNTKYIQTVLHNNNITMIDEVLGGDIEKSKVKKIVWQKEKFPDADIYYIGDTVGDIIEGKEAEVKTIGVSWGFHSKEILSNSSPDFTLDTPKDIKLIIK